MADKTTIARPYAKAIFEFAIEHKALSDWSCILNALTAIVSNPATRQFIDNPLSTVEQQKDLLLSVVTQVHHIKEVPFTENLIHLLAINHRLLVLPDICLQFEKLRAQFEKTLTVDVVSFSMLTEAQMKALAHRLGVRLQRQVTLNVRIDTSLLGGAIISADDFVFDGSVRSKIEKLGTDLAA